MSYWFGKRLLSLGLCALSKAVHKEGQHKGLSAASEMAHPEPFPPRDNAIAALNKNCWEGLSPMQSAAAEWQVTAKWGLLPAVADHGVWENHSITSTFFLLLPRSACCYSVPRHWCSESAGILFHILKEISFLDFCLFVGWWRWMKKYGILCITSDSASSLCLDSCHLRLTIWQRQTCTNFHIVVKAVMY